MMVGRSCGSNIAKGHGTCGVGIFRVRSTGAEAGVRWAGGVTCERSGIGSGVVGMLSCSGRGEGGAGGSWTVSGGLIAVGACG